ncbi:hypothetical protein ACHAW5_002236, partial [Stephanodiscus triporus]
TPFPVGSVVLLRDLVSAPHLNGARGTVRSRPNPDRQEVYIHEAKRSMAVKPANLRYEPRDVGSLSASEVRGALRVLYDDRRRKGKGGTGCGEDDDDGASSGMDEAELRRLLRREVAATPDDDDDDDDDVPVGERIAGLVARSNEPPGGTMPPPSSQDIDGERLRQGAERMASMTPDDLRRQAATMRAMGPSAIRAMHPQMGRMSDEQINMAIAQMEGVADDPAQLRMAAEQMKNMSEGELKRALDRTTAMAGAGVCPVPTMNDGGGGSGVPNVSRAQLEEAAKQMSSMSPSQLRQQAAMLRSVPLETLRGTNPHMSQMTDSQIEASIAQLEAMANNPDMMRMAFDALSDPGKMSSDANAMDRLGAITGGLLSDPDQLNSAVKAMKRNPDMLKQMLTSQKGISEVQREQMTRAIDSFATMDDEKLERYLRLANVVQNAAVRPIVRAKEALGLSTRTTLFILWLIMTLLACFVGLIAWRWWHGTRDDGVGNSMSVEDDGGLTPIENYYNGDGEF